jgi:hypothetical protein
MANELINFLVSFPKLHTVHVYVNRPQNPRAYQPSNVQSQQFAVLNAVRKAFSLNPAIQEVRITRRLPHGHAYGTECRSTKIEVQSDGMISEESWLVNNENHMNECELGCSCGENDWVFERFLQFVARHQVAERRSLEGQRSGN